MSSPNIVTLYLGSLPLPPFAAKVMVRITMYVGEPSNRRVYHLYVWGGEYTKVGGDRWNITTFEGNTAILFRDYGDKV